nr:hypothetical protein [Desulfobulbaceae bacterium]
MKKNEKILIALVAVAGLYGLIDFTLRATVADRTISKSAPHLSQQLTAISSELQSISTDENVTLASLTATITQPWGADIFLKQGLPVTKKAPSDEPDVDKTDELTEQIKKDAQKLSYSGFLTMGTETIALIDGLDYREKETVNGFHITSITPAAIELKKNGITFTLLSKTESRSGLYSTVKDNSDTKAQNNSGATNTPPSTY